MNMDVFLYFWARYLQDIKIYMKVYVIRHTKVVLNGEDYCYGFTDVNVTEDFYTQAEKTKKLLDGIKPEKAFTSPLSRAVKLATYCGYATAESDPRLKEMNFGDWEQKPWKDILKNESASEFFLHYIENRTPNGESLMDQFARVKEFIQEKKKQGYNKIFVFCHGGTINCMRTLAGQCHLNDAFYTIPDFGSVIELDF